ncbi:MAG: ComEC/Rec2 family competence protein [Armatimonadota bacterium]|nr:ComEC/Rec2 family competence protein [Armatimonadota bacterium]
MALICGMALAHLLAASPLPLAVGCAACAVLSLVGSRVAADVSLAPLLGCFLCLGGFIYAVQTAVPGDDISHLTGMHDAVVEGVAITSPEQRGWRRRLRLRVERVRDTRSGAVIAAGGTAEARLPLEPALALGDRVRLGRASVEKPPAAELPGQFDYRAWLATQGVRAMISAREARRMGEERGWRLWLARAGLGLRRRVMGSISRAMPGADAGLYSRLFVGMVYGLEAAPLPDTIVEQFRRAGTVHLLVVSGAQISMIAVAIVGLTGVGFHGLRWWQVGLAGAGVAILVLIVGMEASVSRAVGMFAVVMLAGLTRRDYDIFTSIGLAAALICVFDAQALLSLSFQLTFAATLGVALFLPGEPLQRIDGTRASWPVTAPRAVLWGTFGAWVMTTPLLAHSVSGFAVSGNLANLANVPLSVAIMVLGFVALPIALFSPLSPLLSVLCWLARGLLAVVMHVNWLAASLPVAFVPELHMGLGACVLWYGAVAVAVVLGGFSLAHRKLDEALLRMHPNLPAVSGFVVVCLLAATYLVHSAAPRHVEITLLPVGAGQCAVVRTPDDAAVMIDCGGGSGVPGGGREVAEAVVLPFLSARRITRLDAVIITHWETDHCNALPEVMRRVRVARLIAPPQLPDATAPAWVSRLPATPAGAGDVLRLGDNARVELLEPRLPYLSGTSDDANNNSVVAMLRCDDVRVLFTGDLQQPGMVRLLRDARSTGRSLAAEALVLPHHGRGLAGMAPLLDAVAPAWALVSCDHTADRYITAEARAVLGQRGIRLLRTDLSGQITLVTDGSRVRVVPSRAQGVGAELVAGAGR